MGGREEVAGREGQGGRGGEGWRREGWGNREGRVRMGRGRDRPAHFLVASAACAYVC